MPRLSGSDYRNVLEVLREAGDVEGPIPFPRPVLEALRRLVPCDVVTYRERIGLGHARLGVHTRTGAVAALFELDVDAAHAGGSRQVVAR